MNQPPTGKRALSDESPSGSGAAQDAGKKPDAKALTLVGAGMLTILASVVTLFVDKLSLPLRVSLTMGLFGIGLAGAAAIMQTVPDRWLRPVGAVAVGTAGLMTLTFFLVPRPKAASAQDTGSQTSARMTLQTQPDHGGINTAFIASDTLVVEGSRRVRTTVAAAGSLRARATSSSLRMAMSCASTVTRTRDLVGALFVRAGQGCMFVLVQGPAEAVVSSDMEFDVPSLAGDRFGHGMRWRGPSQRSMG